MILCLAANPDRELEYSINNYRLENGLHELEVDERLRQAALDHIIWQLQYDCFSHQCDGEPYFVDRICYYIQPCIGWFGEVQTKNTNDILNVLKDSPLHNEMLLNPRATSFGTAVIYPIATVNFYGE